MSYDAVTAVLQAHDQELMAIPGVVGVAVSLLEDGKTPCLKILVEKRTPELMQKLPTSLDGHPVVVEESGILRPLDPQ